MRKATATANVIETLTPSQLTPWQIKALLSKRDRHARYALNEIVATNQEWVWDMLVRISEKMGKDAEEVNPRVFITYMLTFPDWNIGDFLSPETLAESIVYLASDKFEEMKKLERAIDWFGADNEYDDLESLRNRLFSVTVESEII